MSVGSYVPFEFNRNSKSGDPVSLEGARLWFVDNGGGGDDDIVRTLYSKRIVECEAELCATADEMRGIK
jgi:hypothetical protein